MYEMTPEHKKKISDSCKGKTRNKGKIYVTNGVEVHSIQESELDSYVKRGFRRGRLKTGENRLAWNKGLKATDGPRVAKRTLLSSMIVYLKQLSVSGIYKVKETLYTI